MCHWPIRRTRNLFLSKRKCKPNYDFHLDYCYNLLVFLYTMYIDLTIYFLLDRKHSVNFHNQRVWRHLAADYTIIMSRTLKVKGTYNHVMYDRSVWFLRLIMSSSRALCCLPSLKKQKHDFHSFFRSMYMYNKTIIRISVFVISNIIKVSARVISLNLWLWLIPVTPTLTYIYDITKNLIQ